MGITVPQSSLLSAFGHPVQLFSSLDRSAAYRAPLYLLAALLPLVPIITAFSASEALRREFAANPETHSIVGHVPLVALGLGIVALLAQLAMLSAHLLVFGIATRLAGTRASARLINTAWLYAILPLVLRQFVLLAVSVFGGAEWYASRAWLLQLVDPFLLWTAFLLFLACRKALGLSLLAALTVVFVSSFIGLLGPLTEAALRD